MDLSELGVSVARHKKSVISTYVVRIHLDRPLPHPDIFESTTFSFGYGPHPHVSGEGRHTNRQLFWISSLEWKFLNTLWIVWTMNLVIFLIRELTKIEPSSLLWMSCVNSVLRKATSTHALSWVLECTCQTRVDGQIRFEYGYMCTWKFLNPERKSCGFKNIQIRVDGAPINVNRLRLLPKASTWPLYSSALPFRLVT